MRLHPVIPMVIRHLMAPAIIGGIDLPRGTNVGPSILLGHASDHNFPEPERFRPERFLEGEVAPHTWIPFGGGVRRCIGAGFSVMEGVAVLREILVVHDVSLPAGARRPPQGPQHHQRPAPRRPGEGQSPVRTCLTVSRSTSLSVATWKSSSAAMRA